MAHVAHMNPVFRKTKPIFLLFEISSDPAARRQDPILLQNILRAIRCFPSYGSDFFPRLYLYPFGKGCSHSPQYYEDLQQVRPEEILGAGNVSLAQALERLNRDLSRSTGLNISGGCLSPVILLVSACPCSEEARRIMPDVYRNPWFRVSLRGIFCHGSQPDPEFLASFLTCAPREAVSRNLLHLFSHPGISPEEVEFLVRKLFFTGKRVDDDPFHNSLSGSPEGNPQGDYDNLVIMDPNSPDV